ncbi:YggS family pyridoxal phosphate-dependent enzyme [Desulfotomaculum copahuensis]|uniref:Pyridoxal phosphate homeostasis protein n=1 Tax=Desulfotomaculum copahuensis TaxID=1838280 RepID=A0A1B7LET7_9FIRM|nr:YggS family pyridoxal phosphate-dependent enzyme [Desulfotomaculum copahuensis]OAT81782.1 YggS family pyridoxal phosphate enzyme [Desulfotomaculum copahuensis]
MASIGENLRHVKETAAAAARRAGRDPARVQLVVVTKTVAPDRIAEALAAGATACGENRVQELLAKQPELPSGVQWHLIGHLQTNKVKLIAGRVQLIHSLDSLHLAREIGRRAVEKGWVAPVLVQVNVAGDPAKYGLPPGEVAGFLQECLLIEGLQVRGLMTIPPLASRAEESRPVFRALRLLAEELRQKMPSLPLELLSMGMSSDYAVAVEEGATLIRVGTAIFGPREG